MKNEISNTNSSSNNLATLLTNIASLDIDVLHSNVELEITNRMLISFNWAIRKISYKNLS